MEGYRLEKKEAGIKRKESEKGKEILTDRSEEESMEGSDLRVFIERERKVIGPRKPSPNERFGKSGGVTARQFCG